MESVRRRLAVGVATALVGALALGGCSGGDSSGSGAGPSVTNSASMSPGATTSEPATSAPPGPPPYLPVPDGVTLTDPGSELGVGETGVVAWRTRAGRVGVLKLTVRRLERADIKALRAWELDAPKRASSLYYVTVKAKNLGADDLGGQRIPLYVQDGRSNLVESTSFHTRFAPCPSPALPEKFKPGAMRTVCLVYLVPRHGDLVAVTFRPAADFNPVTWVGKVHKWKPPAKGKGDQGDQGDQDDEG